MITVEEPPWWRQLSAAGWRGSSRIGRWRHDDYPDQVFSNDEARAAERQGRPPNLAYDWVEPAPVEEIEGPEPRPWEDDGKETEDLTPLASASRGPAEESAVDQSPEPAVEVEDSEPWNQ